MAGRKRQFGNIRPLPSGRFQASYTGPDGKRVNAPKTFKLKRDASAWLAGVEADITRGVLQKPTVEKITFGEYAENWLASRTLAPNSRNTYATMLRLYILPTFGPMLLGGILAKHVSDWHAEMGKTTGQSTRALAYIVLHAIMRTAVEQDERIPKNPCRVENGGAMKKPLKKEVLQPSGVATVVETVDPRYRAMVLVNMYGHLRHGELIGLQRGDIDLEAGAIHINFQIQRIDGQWMRVDLKSAGSERTVHVPVVVVEALEKHLVNFVADGPRAPVFTTRLGNPPARNNYNLMLKRAGQKIGWPNLHSHDLRHAGLTFAAQNGATTKELMERGGHKRVDVAMRYQHGSQSRDQELATRMEAVIAPALVGSVTAED